MNIIKYIKYRLPMVVIIGASCLTCSCTDDFKDMNTNDFGVTDDMLDYDNLRVGGFITAMQRDVIPTSDTDAGDYQLAVNLTGDIFSGYMGTINDKFQANNWYDLKNQVRWNDRAFEVAYRNVMPSWKMINDKADHNSIEFALAQVLKVAAMHRLADNYGPLPYLRFGQGLVNTPYDALDVVYEKFFEELDEAIAIMSDFVSKNPTARPLKQYDLVYGGDFTKWLKFANSLKLRLAMRTVYVDEEKARQRAAEAVAGGVMETVSDNANLASANGITVYNPLKVCWDAYSDTRMGANMQSILGGYYDGRIASYFRESTFDNIENGYYGVRNGVMLSAKSDYLPLSVPNVEAETPVRWMCVSEVYFLRAEGALRGWSAEMGGDARSLYEEGIKTSFEDWKASMREDYLYNDAYIPSEYIDYVEGNDVYRGDPNMSSVSIPWNEYDDFERNLERIITQKWIAMYPNGQEAWAEYRRTGYPVLFPVLVNMSDDIDTDEQVRRITFPQSEYDNNEEEVKKAVSLLDGPDTGGTHLWWDKK